MACRDKGEVPCDWANTALRLGIGSKHVCSRDQIPVGGTWLLAHCQHNALIFSWVVRSNSPVSSYVASDDSSHPAHSSTITKPSNSASRVDLGRRRYPPRFPTPPSLLRLLQLSFVPLGADRSLTCFLRLFLSFPPGYLPAFQSCSRGYRPDAGRPYREACTPILLRLPARK